MLCSWRWEQWHKQSATACVCKFGRYLWQSRKLGSLCFASKENNGNSKHHINGLVRMKFLAFSNDIMYALPHWPMVIVWHWECAVRYSKNNNHEYKLQLVLYGWSQCGHMDLSTKLKPSTSQNCFSWTTDHWTIAMYSCQMTSAQLKTECTHHDFLYGTTLFCSIIHNFCPWNVIRAH